MGALSLLLSIFFWCIEYSASLNVTIVAGTHFPSESSNPDNPELCGQLERAIFNEWKQFGSEHVPGKVAMLSDEQILQMSNVHCVLGIRNIKFSFPLDTPDCLEARSVTFRKLSALGFLTPHLVSMSQKLQDLGILPKIVIFWISDPSSMYATNGGVCLSKTSLTDRQIHRLHRTMTNVLLFQTFELINRYHVQVKWITSSIEQEKFLEHEPAAVCSWDPSLKLSAPTQIPQLISFAQMTLPDSSTSQKSICSEVSMGLNALKYSHFVTSESEVQILPKRAIFIAGLEGTGHHLFQKYLGYIANSKYLCVNRDVSLAIQIYFSSPDNEKLKINYNKLSGLLSKLGTVCENKPFLVNTYFGAMMMSYPYGDDWAGPMYCKLPIRGRQCLTIPDVVSLYLLFKSHSIHLDVLFINRPLGASIVSTAIHRKFQPIISQSTVLATALQELVVQLSLVSSFDGVTVTCLNFYDLYIDSTVANNFLLKFFNVDKGSYHGNEMSKFVRQMYLKSPNISSVTWKSQMPAQVLPVISKMFGYIDARLN